VPIVLKSGSLNLLESYGPFQACNGIALLVLLVHKLIIYIYMENSSCYFITMASSN
jgi:hypothetical protein